MTTLDFFLDEVPHRLHNRLTTAVSIAHSKKGLNDPACME